jgi:hypothetical protein
MNNFFFLDIVYLEILDWGTIKPLDKQPVSTPIKRDDKRVGAPDEVKGKEIEILWPTEHEIQEGEYAKPQWERKQVNVRNENLRNKKRFDSFFLY